MVRNILKICSLLVLMMMCFACGHTNTSHIGLISFGDIENKVIPERVNGPTLEGSDGGYSYYLSEAARDALENTEYDTLVDVEVTTSTGLFVPSNKIIVKGKALNSKELEPSGGEK